MIGGWGKAAIGSAGQLSARDCCVDRTTLDRHHAVNRYDGMADVTMKQGIEQSLKRHIPEITAVMDVTDHSSGTNPYYAANTEGESAV